MSLTKVSYSMITGAPANALDFGAVADGTTNNTTAVQAALNSLPIAGGLVEIPAGCRFNIKSLTFRQNCNLQYYVNDDLSTPGQAPDIGSGELVYFSANSSWPTDPTGGAVNEWRFTAAFHPGIVTDVRKDVQGANAYLAPGQTLTEPARASWNIQDEQVSSFTLMYKNFSSNSTFAGVSQNTYRRVITLNGVGTANWPTLPSVGNQVCKFGSVCNNTNAALIARFVAWWLVYCFASASCYRLICCWRQDCINTNSYSRAIR